MNRFPLGFPRPSTGLLAMAEPEARCVLSVDSTNPPSWGALRFVSNGAIEWVDDTVLPGARTFQIFNGDPDLFMVPLPAGDFQAILRCSALSMTINANSGIWITSGLTVGAGNHAAVCIDYYSGATRFAAVRLGTNLNSFSSLPVSIRWSSPENFIRVTRVGANYSAAWSRDGILWTPENAFTPVSPTYIGLGLFHANAASSQMFAVYSFKIYAPTAPDAVMKRRVVLGATL